MGGGHSSFPSEKPKRVPELERWEVLGAMAFDPEPVSLLPDGTPDDLTSLSYGLTS